MHATAPGATLGTPYYMSPEQAKGAAQIDLRSDLYSVGVMLYECVSGKVPFDAGTFNELIFRIVLESPAPLESFAPDLDPGFIAIVRKAIARARRALPVGARAPRDPGPVAGPGDRPARRPGRGRRGSAAATTPAGNQRSTRAGAARSEAGVLGDRRWRSSSRRARSR